MSKKRKVDDEHRVFQERWSTEYFFIQLNDKPVCLICSESVSVIKEYNLKRHYLSKHFNYENLKCEERKEKFKKLKTALDFQKNLFRKGSHDADAIVRASFVISQKIAKYSKNYSDGEFVKECLQEVFSMLCPDKKKDVDGISLSRRTITRRIDEIAVNVENTLTEIVSKFEYFSLALDESTDISDVAQLAVFVRGIDINFHITDEFLGLCAMRGTTTGDDIFQEMKTVMAKFSLPFEKLQGVATDGAPAMTGKNVGLISKIKSQLTSLNLETKGLSVFHCIIHQQNLCAKSIKFSHVMKIVVSTINFIKSRALNHRQFKDFLEDLEVEYGDIIYYCEVRWLSKGAMLKRFYNLRSEINTFMEIKGKLIPELNNDEWVRDLAFLVDLTAHLNELNLTLQGKNQFIHNLYAHIKSFQMKLQLWERQLINGNAFHFPTLKIHGGPYLVYAEEIKSVNMKFDDRFADFRSQESNLRIFSSPFDVTVDEVPEDLQMEIIDLQNNEELKNRMKNCSLLDFYKNLSRDTYPCISDFARKKMSLIGSTYKCEQVFSKMKFLKSKARSRLSDEHLQNNLRIATTQILPNVDNLVKCIQTQKSH